MNSTRSISLDIIRRALARPAPGLPAQLHMSPPYRAGIVPREIVNPHHGGVLILLYPKDGELHFVLTKRTDHLDTHKGQISLPGGGHEAHDEDYGATALREAREELGIALDRYELFCSLSTLYIPPSNFYIYPLVAYVSPRPAFAPDHNEVAELIEVPVATLLDPQTRIVEEWTLPQYNDMRVAMPHYLIPSDNLPRVLGGGGRTVGAHKVWGATAMVLAEFAAMVGGE